MAIKLVREFQQKQQVSLTPQLKKSIELLQLSRLEIIKKIDAEIDDNPFISKSDYEVLSSAFDDDSYIENFSEPQTLNDFLELQLQDLGLNASQKKIGTVLIHFLEESGMLSTDIVSIQDSMDEKFSISEIQICLEKIIHQLEPAGIGGRTFKEMIFLQLERRDLNQLEMSLSKELLFNSKYTNFKEAKYELLKDYSEESFQKIVQIIKGCDLSPGLNFQPTDLIRPDLKLILSENHMDVTFIEDDFPKLALDEDLEKLAKEKKNKSSAALKEKIGNAKWLIKAVGRRNETVQRVGTLICHKQSDFLLGKSAELHPLNSLELAKELKLSTSTISRILRCKYIQTPKGIVAMKSLLANSVSRTKKVTPFQLMEEIQSVVMTETKKLSDQKISELLNQRGFNLARRTISKYRQKISIPNSRNR